MITFDANAVKSRSDLFTKMSLSDMFVLKLHMFVFTWLGMRPVKLGSREYFYGKVYAVAILSLLLSLSIWSSINLMVDEVTDTSFFLTFLKIVYCCSIAIFYATLLVGSLSNLTSWENLLEKLHQLAEHCNANGQKVEKKKWKLFKCVLLPIILICYSIEDLIFWKQISGIQVNSLLYIPAYIRLFYQLTVATVISEFSVVLKSWYEYLQQNVETILKEYCDGNNQQEFINNIGEIRFLYRLLLDVVEIMNIIFGKTLLVFFVLVQASVLSDIGWMIYWNLSVKMEVYLQNFYFLILNLVSICFEFHLD